LDFPGCQADDEQHMIPNQSRGRPQFHREEIGGCQYLPMCLEKFLPGESFSPLGRRLPSCRLQHLGDGAAPDFMVEVSQRALNAGVPPGPVLAGQLQGQILDWFGCGGSTWLASSTGIVFLGDEPPMPGQQGVGRDETGKLVEGGATDAFAFEGQAATLIVVEARFFAQLFFEDANFLLEIRADVILVAIQLASDREDEQGERIHRQIIPDWKSGGQHNRWGERSVRSHHAAEAVGARKGRNLCDLFADKGPVFAAFEFLDSTPG